MRPAAKALPSITSAPPAVLVAALPLKSSLPQSASRPSGQTGATSPEWGGGHPPDSAAVSSSPARLRSEEHTSELQSLMRTSYAAFCLKNKKKINHQRENNHTGRNGTLPPTRTS